MAVLLRKKKEKRAKIRREDEHRKLHRPADVRASWKKVKRVFLYSKDTAFTQHKHDKYSLQTKGQKPADKEIFERHVSELMAPVIVMVSIKSAHALYRDSRPLSELMSSD